MNPRTLAGASIFSAVLWTMLICGFLLMTGCADRCRTPDTTGWLGGWISCSEGR